MIGEARQWTYAELAEEVSAVASALRIAGIRPGDTVAVLGPKGAEQIIALLAILAAGGVYLPIGVDQPADRAEKILATGGVRMALYCGDLAPSWKPSLTVTEALRIGRRADGPFVPADTDPHDLAYVLFTSGSTGEPKGVEVTHDAAMNTAEFLYGHFNIGPDDRCLALATLECDLSVLDMFATLATGGSIVVVDEPYRRDPDRWAALIAEHGVTVLNFLPGWLEMLVSVNDGVGADRLASVRVVLTGGDWVRTAMVRHLQAQAPGVRVAGLGGDHVVDLVDQEPHQLVAHGDDRTGVVDVLPGELGDVDETVLATHEVHESAEVDDVDDLALVDLADLGFLDNAEDPLARRLDLGEVGIKGGRRERLPWPDPQSRSLGPRRHGAHL